MLPVHDIRSSIPMTDMTNPSKFKQYSFEEYPKMLTQVCDKAYVNAWMERKAVIDDRTGKASYPGSRPRVGSLVPVLDENDDPVRAMNADEEDVLRQLYPQAVVVKNTIDYVSENTSLQDENEQLRRQLAEMKAKAESIAKENASPDANPQPEAAKSDNSELPAALGMVTGAPPKRDVPFYNKKR